jgi:ribosomal protein S21
MSAHKNLARDSGKRGLTVEVKVGRDENEAKRNMEHAIKTLKRRLMQEGMLRDMRKHEYAETKGQVRRKKREEAIRRRASAKRKAARPPVARPGKPA